MKNVIYDFTSYKVIAVTTNEVCISKLKTNEDFTNLETWNEWREVNKKLEKIE